tara:strand:+ start:36839 stop:37915 length:1077 start_codon:yes stop_codon:yes gene_type:complete
MSGIKRINKGDILTRKHTVSRTNFFGIGGGTSNDWTLHHYESGSSNPDSASIYNLLYHLYYKPNNNNTYGTQYVFDTGSVSSNTGNDGFQFRHKFADKGVLLSLSSSMYGERIKSGSLFIIDAIEHSAVNWIIRDDGYGNLYNSNGYGVSGSMTFPNRTVYQDQSGSFNPLSSSISSSINYVGNVFYDEGLIVISAGDELRATPSYGNIFYSSSFTNKFGLGTPLWYGNVDSEETFYSTEYLCKVKSNEFNWSMNPTLYKYSTTPHKGQSGSFNPNPGQKGYEHIFEWNPVDSGSEFLVNPKFQHPDFQPYITGVKLYNEDLQPVMVGKFSQPVKKLGNQDMTIKIQLDHHIDNIKDV